MLAKYKGLTPCKDYCTSYSTWARCVDKLYAYPRLLPCVVLDNNYTYFGYWVTSMCMWALTNAELQQLLALNTSLHSTNHICCKMATCLHKVVLHHTLNGTYLPLLICSTLNLMNIKNTKTQGCMLSHQPLDWQLHEPNLTPNAWPYYRSA